MIGSKDLARGAREGYLQYVFDILLDLFKAYPLHWENRQGFIQVYWQYFAASFANRLPVDIVWHKAWVDALWEIRQTGGQEFTDLSLVQASHLLDEPNFTQDGPFNVFFYLCFRYGEQAVTDDSKKLIMADKILERRGLLTPK
jgi:hypothetical protein